MAGFSNYCSVYTIISTFVQLLPVVFFRGAERSRQKRGDSVELSLSATLHPVYVAL